MERFCSICYTNDGYMVSCADETCTSRICEDCFESYLDFCKDKKTLVKCTNEYCKSYIISQNFSYNNKYFNKYKETLITSFMNSNGEEVKDKLLYSSIVEKLRKDKSEFIKKFPKAIDLAVNIGLSDKLKMICKTNRESIKKKVGSSNKLCMISHCDGKLSDNFECMKCSSKFCKECEKIYKKGHKCNPEDVESMKFINNSRIVKCPNCSVCIERSSGCNNMTCVSCRTNFDFSTGEIGGSGSYNEAISEQKKKFKFDFKQDYNSDIAEKLFKIEQLEPKEPSNILLNNALKKLIQNEKDINEEEIVISFEKYIKSRLMYIKFIGITTDITEHHFKGDINNEYLDSVLESM